MLVQKPCLTFHDLNDILSRTITVKTSNPTHLQTFFHFLKGTCRVKYKNNNFEFFSADSYTGAFFLAVLLRLQKNAEHDIGS